MAAFNYIRVPVTCPACSQTVTVEAQTHVASSFGGADRRYCDHTYELGEQMTWWPEGHPKATDWRDLDGNTIVRPNGRVADGCWAKCSNCDTELCVVILFDDRRAIACESVTLATDPPPGIPF